MTGRARAALIALVACACSLSPQPAHAQSKQECVDAYTQGQVARRAKKLKDARAKFDVCSAAVCPVTLRRDCVPWSRELDKEIPTVVVRVVDARGQSVQSARLTIDGEAAPSDASPRLVDPGEHVVRAEASGLQPGEARVTVMSGDVQKEVRVLLVDAQAATPSTPPEGASRPIPTLSIVFAAGAIAGVGAFAVLGAVGSGKKSDLDASGCKPNCSSSDVGAVKTDYIAADVALGLGAASLVTAAVLFFTRPTVEPKAAAAANSRQLPLGAFSASAFPLAGGAGARAELTF